MQDLRRELSASSPRLGPGKDEIACAGSSIAAVKRTLPWLDDRRAAIIHVEEPQAIPRSGMTRHSLSCSPNSRSQDRLTNLWNRPIAPSAVRSWYRNAKPSSSNFSKKSSHEMGSKLASLGLEVEPEQPRLTAGFCSLHGCRDSAAFLSPLANLGMVRGDVAFSHTSLHSFCRHPWRASRLFNSNSRPVFRAGPRSCVA
jgi:hypothetical protein